MTLLARHAATDGVCFGGEGDRDAAQLVAYAQAIAVALPVQPHGARVVVACVDRYRFAAALIAVWLRGYTAELPANGQPATVHALARGSSALLHDLDGQQGLDVRALERVDQRAPLPLSLAIDGARQAVIAYTSGSTGEPVAHPKTFAQLLREPEAHVQGFALAGQRVLAAVPAYHIYGLLFGVLVPLLGGGSMSRRAPLLPADVLHEIESQRATVLIAVPPQLTALAAHDGSHWPALQRVFSSAAPLPAETSRALAARGWRVTEILGSTETGGIAHRSAPDAPWQPLLNVRVTIEDDALCVDSPWLSPRESRPLRTNDRVEPAGDGFRHLGRSDAVVKIGGRRVDLGEVEARLRGCEGVRDARVLAVESRGVRGVELWAVVESEHATAAVLKRTLVQHVDPVALPRRFRILPKLPRSSTGKLARRDLLALFEHPSAIWTFPREQCPDGSITIQVPVECGYFRGHFDEQPILPGVVQLQHVALQEARRRFPELRVLQRVARVKFKRLIAPGETLSLRLERRGPTSVQFAIEAEGQPAASGVLHFVAQGTEA